MSLKDSPVEAVEWPRLSEESVVPLYERVKRQISEAILVGRWPPGTMLPSEVALAAQLGVAVGTVRRALVDLAAEGLISRRRKTGTVVTGRSPHHNLRYFFQYFRLHRRDGTLQRSVARVVSLERQVASSSICEKLELEPGAEVIRLERVREIDGRAVLHDFIMLPAARVPGFPMDPKAVPQLVYVFLLERYGIRVSAVREQLGAALATPRDCELLGMTAPAALLTIEELLFDQANLPIIYGERRATTENHVYVNEVR